jgi:hypothetical protein
MRKNDAIVCEECQQPIQYGQQRVVVFRDHRGIAIEFAHMKCGSEQEDDPVLFKSTRRRGSHACMGAKSSGDFAHPERFKRGPDSVPYSEGFKRAAEVLVAYALEHPLWLDFLAYPACFNYRQFIELELKTLVDEAQKLYDLCEKMGTTIHTKLSWSESPKLDGTHSIKQLVGWLTELVRATLDQPLNANMKRILTELHTFDPYSTAFRYPKDKKGKPSHPPTRIDLRQVRLQMARLDAHLHELRNALVQFRL